MPDKPIIFFSHSSKDKKNLVRLKELFDEKTGGVYDVFLSSDGSSIKFGHNWVSSIQMALEKASLMFVFITNNSIESDWIYFESGFAYAKAVQVVPVGLLGKSLDSIRPPLGLLQGFNVRSHEGLDNLIVIVNEKYGHHHSARFQKPEFEEIISLGTGMMASPFGEKTDWISEVELEIIGEHKSKTGVEFNDKLKQVLEERQTEFQINNNRTYFSGVCAEPWGDQNLDIKVAVHMIDSVVELINDVLEALDNSKLKLGMKMRFFRDVGFIAASHDVTGRIPNISICKGGEFNEFSFKDLSFWIHDQAISITFNNTRILLDQAKDLIDMLFTSIVHFRTIESK